MPSTASLHSTIADLATLMPTVKEAVLAKQGLRALRDALLYQHDGAPLTLDDTPRLAELGVTNLLLTWLQSPSGQGALEDIRAGQADALLEQFEAVVAKIETVRLTLAYAAPTEDLVRYHQWFTQVLKQPVLLDVAIDPKLLAGFTAMFHDHYLDYSVVSQLPQLEAAIQQQYQTYAQNVPGLH